MININRRTIMRGAGVIAATAALPSISSARAQPSDSRPWADPSFTDVSVHDPDLVRVDDTYYVFGSHGAAASTTDLLHWEQISGDDVSPTNPLFDDVTQELAEVFEWSTVVTLWAPGNTQLPDGRFYYYYCSCEGSSPLSGMGVAVADDPLGPYSNLGLILRSGMVDEPSEDGSPYNALVHPNVIDADPFQDASGNWWLLYGSFSGGIFIMTLDPDTGKPHPGQGYGKHLMGGNHARIEGPAIFYHPGTGYYYLFVTFGGLDAAGGYNIRVSRSRNPDGPYVDISGTDMSTVKSDPELPIFDDVTIQPHGTKIAGNHQFLTPTGEPGAGYVSPGGCVPWYDDASGELFIAFHTRFPGTGEFHRVRTHRMAMTSDGWPVIFPFRYAGEKVVELEQESRTGDFAIVEHEKPINGDVPLSKLITLLPGGRVGGANGRWSKLTKNSIALTLDGTCYETIFARQWDPDLEAWSTTFTGLATDGTSIWGAAR